MYSTVFYSRLFVFLLIRFVLAFIPMYIAGKKYYSKGWFWLYGVFGLIPAILHAVFLPDASYSTSRKVSNKAIVSSVALTLYLSGSIGYSVYDYILNRAGFLKALKIGSVALIIIEILVCVLTLVDVLKCRITKTFVCALFANAFYGIANPLLLWLSLNIWAKRPEGSVMSRPYWNPAGFISFVVMGIFAQRIMRGKEKPGKAMSCFLPVIIAVVTTIVYIFTNPYVQRMPLPTVEIILKVSIRTALFGLYMYFNEKKEVL